MAEVKNLVVLCAAKDVKELEFSDTAGGKEKWYNWCVKQLTVSEKVKYAHTHISQPKYLPKRKESMCSHKNMNVNIQSSFICINCKLETFQVSASGRLDKQRQGLPCNPLVRTPRFRSRGPGSIAGQGTKIPHVVQRGKTQISKNKLGYKHLKSTKDISRCPWYIYNGRPLSKKKERQDRGAGERARAGERQRAI